MLTVYKYMTAAPCDSRDDDVSYSFSAAYTAFNVTLIYHVVGFHIFYQT